MPERIERPRTSTRDYAVLRTNLESWLATKLPAGSEPAISGLEVPPGNGMSSETVTFDLTMSEGGGRRTSLSCVARMAPLDSAMPVFPRYELDRQFRVMRLVGERTGVPVPRALWFEAEPDALGSPLFVMEHVDGAVPADVMPYNFEGWLLDAAPADRQRLQAATVEVLAGVHSLTPANADLAFLEFDRAGPTALHRHVAELRAYYEWVARQCRHPLIERGFTWLDRHWPEPVGEPVLVWGDARIGNILYRDFRPVGVLDWEMAAVGPRELDLGWLIYHHRFFEELAGMAGLDGMPGFLTASDVTDTYEALTGHTVTDLGFYIVYAALRSAVVMARVAHRQAYFGEREFPDDPDDVFYNRPGLEAMLAGGPGDAAG
ncbi:phosphotransferase family protein [Haloechinothrix sp. YIM 98757]|uniref:Phosphotransferase family protein n=1 Tax=Haloechinothrix aidingensis TaxID=2752311 RepID=A0A838ACJ1_9PSEU|nr:phosphotransferase family protein [Haloechinothrix aidingensis]MBA0126972.1 phosphotransferase family protein [Haloechinothrix aidingensis]